MGRGGKRPGAGRKKGDRNRPKLLKAVEPSASGQKPTPAERMRALKRQVVLCVADGMQPSTIAAVIGVSVEKLHAIFSHELEHGVAIVRAEELMRLDAQSDEGKTSATKALLANTARETSNRDQQLPAAAASRSVSDYLQKVQSGALRILDGGKK